MILGRVKVSEIPFYQGLKPSEEYLLMVERGLQSVLRGHQPVRISPTGIMLLLVNYITRVSVLISDKYRS